MKNEKIWEIGSNYVIRTVTMIQVGKLVYVGDNELVLETCAWVADTGRWTQFLQDANVSEVEPVPEGRVIKNEPHDTANWIRLELEQELEL